MSHIVLSCKIFNTEYLLAIFFVIVYNERMIAINKEKTIAFTGHRILEDDIIIIENAVKEACNRYIENGFDTFLCGMAIGFDLLCGKAIIDLKKTNDNIKLICCIPYKNSEKYFSKKDKELFNLVLNASDETIVLANNYYNGCFHARDKFMVDNSSTLISYKIRDNSGTGYTTAYAAILGKKILSIKDIIDNEKNL